MNKEMAQGVFFDERLLKDIRSSFYYIEKDPFLDEERIFFDNAGGSFRLKKANKAFKKFDSIPDCPEHSNRSAKMLLDIEKKGMEDIRMMFNAPNGKVVTSLSASMVIFEMTRAVIENVPGTNVVTTELEHPSAFDSVVQFATKMNKEVRVAKTNPVTGGVDVDEIVKLIDNDTCLLSFIYASNISGAILDAESIVRESRKVKPDLYILVDSVQHMPHAVVDLTKVPVDGMNFAPYKFFGVRGLGVGILSERAAKLPHNKLAAKAVDEWSLGSPAPAHFSAISKIVDYVTGIGKEFIQSHDRRELYVEGMERIALQERALMHAMLTGTNEAPGLRQIEGVTVHLDYEDLTKRDFIVPISFNNIKVLDAVAEYEKRGVIVFERLSSSLYSKRMLDSFDIDEVIRVSPLHCHSQEEISRFLQVTAEIATL